MVTHPFNSLVTTFIESVENTDTIYWPDSAELLSREGQDQLSSSSLGGVVAAPAGVVHVRSMLASFSSLHYRLIPLSNTPLSLEILVTPVLLDSCT